MTFETFGTDTRTFRLRKSRATREHCVKKSDIVLEFQSRALVIIIGWWECDWFEGPDESDSEMNRGSIRSGVWFGCPMAEKVLVWSLSCCRLKRDEWQILIEIKIRIKRYNETRNTTTRLISSSSLILKLCSELFFPLHIPLSIPSPLFATSAELMIELSTGELNQDETHHIPLTWLHKEAILISDINVLRQESRDVVDVSCATLLLILPRVSFSRIFSF